jgi:hypothetical protein
MNLPKPKIQRCSVDPDANAPIPCMELQWDIDAPGVMERAWHLPDGVVLQGPAPKRFGIAIHRLGKDSYRVRVVWNHLSFNWDSLSRVRIMASSLKPLLAALGTDLWQLLEQPAQTVAA